MSAWEDELALSEDFAACIILFNFSFKHYSRSCCRMLLSLTAVRACAPIYCAQHMTHHPHRDQTSWLTECGVWGGRSVYHVGHARNIPNSPTLIYGAAAPSASSDLGWERSPRALQMRPSAPHHMLAAYNPFHARCNSNVFRETFKYIGIYQGNYRGYKELGTFALVPLTSVLLERG